MDVQDERERIEYSVQQNSAMNIAGRSRRVMRIVIPGREKSRIEKQTLLFNLALDWLRTHQDEDALMIFSYRDEKPYAEGYGAEFRATATRDGLGWSGSEASRDQKGAVMIGNLQGQDQPWPYTVDQVMFVKESLIAKWLKTIMP